MVRRVLLVATLGVALAVPAAADLYRDMFRVLDLVATPSGFPLSTTGDGTRVNGARSGRLRIVPVGFGPGYQLELNRTFGNDSRGRPEVFHLLGFGDLVLQGSMQMTAGYSGNRFRTVTIDQSANNMSYSLRTKVGAQDVEFTGNLNVLNLLEVNPLGFYDMTLEVVNRNSEVRLDGVVIRDNQATNFNLGPISVKGNIYVDALAALVTALGGDATALEQAFPSSPVGLLNDAIRDQLQQNAAGAHTLVAGSAAEPSVSGLLGAVLSGDTAMAESMLAQLRPLAEPAAAPPADATAVPEPGTLLLVALGATALASRRRRAR